MTTGSQGTLNGRQLSVRAFFLFCLLAFLCFLLGGPLLVRDPGQTDPNILTETNHPRPRLRLVALSEELLQASVIIVQSASDAVVVHTMSSCKVTQTSFVHDPAECYSSSLFYGHCRLQAASMLGPLLSQPKTIKAGIESGCPDARLRLNQEFNKLACDASAAHTELQDLTSEEVHCLLLCLSADGARLSHQTIGTSTRTHTGRQKRSNTCQENQDTLGLRNRILHASGEVCAASQAPRTLAQLMPSTRCRGTGCSVTKPSRQVGEVASVFDELSRRLLQVKKLVLQSHQRLPNTM